MKSAARMSRSRNSKERLWNPNLKLLCSQLNSFSTQPNLHSYQIGAFLNVYNKYISCNSMCLPIMINAKLQPLSFKVFIHQQQLMQS